MALPARDDQYISLTPTDSPVEDAEMDAGDVPPDQAEQEISRHVRGGLTKLPAATPLTPSSMGVNFQQFCDRLCRDLPGDSTKRECFDTRTRFVRVPDSMISLLWSMRSLGRPDAPIGI